MEVSFYLLMMEKENDPKINYDFRKLLFWELM